MSHRLGATPGTYALVLALGDPCEVRIGRLGHIRFGSPYYLYFGSAFGPGGLGARVSHHLNPVRHPHWHIDYLRQAAAIVDVWYTTDKARLECIWANAAVVECGVSPVPRFGSSDCQCQSHLLAADRYPNLAAFRRRLDDVGLDGRPIHRVRFSGEIAA